jgi:hypothetical protein
MSYYVNPHGHACPWYPAAELFGAPNVKWCEETLCHWVTEPANTWSNVLYILVAFYIYWSARKTKQNELIWLAPAMFIMGLCSLIYHMSNNYLTQVFDFVGMYLFVFWLIILNFRRLKWVSKEKQVHLMVGLSVVCTALIQVMYMAHLKFQIIIALAVLTILATEYICFKRSEKPIKYTMLVTGLILVAIAQAFSLMDAARVEWVCDPQNHWFQGHAVWHIVAAIGLTFAYKHWEQFKFSDSSGQMEFDIDDIETQLEI